MKKQIIKTKWKDMRIKACDSPCYSCGVKNCHKHPDYNDKAWVNHKEKRIRIISECNWYKEQVFELKKGDEEEFQKRVEGLVSLFCWSAVQGQHNITQSSDGWDSMMYKLEKGLAYALTHREAFNQIEEWADKDE